MSSLLEAAAALGVSGVVMVLMTTSLTGAARVNAACIALGDELFRVRQLEHLVDRTTLAAGAGPTRPAPVSSLSDDTVVFASDHDGDGSIDSTSSETTALEVRQSDGDARVRLRLGRQTMTILEAGDSDASLLVLDTRGVAADPTTASLVELSIAAHGGSPDDARNRRMLFSLPARATP